MSIKTTKNHFIALGMKDGKVGCANWMEGEEPDFFFVEDLPYPEGKENSIINCVAALRITIDMLASEKILAAGNRTKILVPESIFNIFNSVDVIEAYVNDRVIINSKEKRPLTKNEHKIYTETFVNYRNNLGRIVLKNPKYAKKTRLPGQELTQEQEAWVELQHLIECNMFGKKDIVACNSLDKLWDGFADDDDDEDIADL